MTAGEVAEMNRQRRLHYQSDKVDNDAAEFRKYVDDHLVFEVCGICAYEGPAVQFVELEDMRELMESGLYFKSFSDYCYKLSPLPIYHAALVIVSIESISVMLSQHLIQDYYSHH